MFSYWNFILISKKLVYSLASTQEIKIWDGIWNDIYLKIENITLNV